MTLANLLNGTTRMRIPPNHQPQVPGSRFERDPQPPGTGRPYRLEGDARPGDVLALAGGALMRDRNENGLVDGYDTPVDATRGTLVDVRG